MRPTLLLTLFALASTSAAAKWEYAALITNEGTMTWQTPAAKGLYTNTDDYIDLLDALKCKVIPDAPTRLMFLNCVGALGWEYIGTEGSSLKNMQLFRKSTP